MNNKNIDKENLPFSDLNEKMTSLSNLLFKIKIDILKILPFKEEDFKDIEVAIKTFLEPKYETHVKVYNIGGKGNNVSLAYKGNIVGKSKGHEYRIKTKNRILQILKNFKLKELESAEAFFIKTRPYKIRYVSSEGKKEFQLDNNSAVSTLDYEMSNNL